SRRGPAVWSLTSSALGHLERVAHGPPQRRVHGGDERAGPHVGRGGGPWATRSRWPSAWRSSPAVGRGTWWISPVRSPPRRWSRSGSGTIRASDWTTGARWTPTGR